MGRGARRARASIHPALGEAAPQLLGPVQDDAKRAGLRLAPQQDEAAVRGDVVVRDRQALAEVVLVLEQRDRLADDRLLTGAVEGNRHHVLAVAEIDLAAADAPARLVPAAFGDGPAAVEARIGADVDLHLSGL